MTNIVLRICVWILGIVATFANLLVILFRSLYQNSSNEVYYRRSFASIGITFKSKLNNVIFARTGTFFPYQESSPGGFSDGYLLVNYCVR